MTTYRLGYARVSTLEQNPASQLDELHRAGFERDLTRVRTMAGLAAARARGPIGGRPPIMTPEKLEVARQLLAAGKSNAGRASASHPGSRNRAAARTGHRRRGRLHRHPRTPRRRQRDAHPCRRADVVSQIRGALAVGQLHDHS